MQVLTRYKLTTEDRSRFSDSLLPCRVTTLAVVAPLGPRAIQLGALPVVASMGHGHISLRDGRRRTFCCWTVYFHRRCFFGLGA